LITRLLIQDWYRLNQYGDQFGTEASVDLSRRVARLVTHGNQLRSLGNDRVAEFMRHGDQPIVRLMLPNFLTMRRHRLIRRTVTKLGGQVLCAPNSVLRGAGIDLQTINVLHVKPSWSPLYADEYLFTGEVAFHDRTDPYWYRRMERARRTAYFLAGHDHNEPAFTFFMCELPPGVEPTTVDEAYHALKPPAVVAALENRMLVLRQGDMFFIRLRTWEPPEGTDIDAKYLHRSNHRGEAVARIKVGGEWQTYVKGKVIHAPAFRDPDHLPLKLGRRHWWLCVPNTVPTVR